MTNFSRQLLIDDPYLSAYEDQIRLRYSRFEGNIQKIKDSHQNVQSYANWHNEVGFRLSEDHLHYREWAPAAEKAALIGDFNDWDHSKTPMTKEGDFFSCKIPLSSFSSNTPHKQKVKIRLTTNGVSFDRVPSTIRTTFQNPENFDFCGLIWFPKKNYQFKNIAPKNAGSLQIYEAHIGMSQEKEGVGTYKEFTDNILPRIQHAGYNAIQFMAIQEHPYYGSFGYQVSSYFAPSSRFGTPEELKELIDTAHGMGIRVILDLVHSHSVKNTNEGLSHFDGTEYQYFHGGAKGYHELWDSRLFNYGKPEVQRFLLSNIKYWIEEFHFDGFRFDGITSMLYSHHGHYKQFNHYDMYFNHEVELEAYEYLQLANYLIKDIKRNAISIAEDISGMPGLCRHQIEGGVGFDYRLHMGVADLWTKLIKETPDENWPLDQIYHELTTGRTGENKICYAESHDQALVGDKTLAFWLMDQEMYHSMAKHIPSMIVDRGISLLKLIRLITMALGGKSYLNFMGNEFGHPEWIDFPREGNGYSYKYARRQWSLRDNPELKYQYLAKFDKDMLTLFRKEWQLTDLPAKLISIDMQNLVLIFTKQDYIWIFNFHPQNSISDYQFGCEAPGTYKIVFQSDEDKYGGFFRIQNDAKFFSSPEPTHGCDQSLKIYTPNRTAILLRKVRDEENRF